MQTVAAGRFGGVGASILGNFSWWKSESALYFSHVDYKGSSVETFLPGGRRQLHGRGWPQKIWRRTFGFGFIV